MSSGAIAGIVIGALAGLALLCGLALIFLRRRHRANEDSPSELSALGPGSSEEPAEKYAYHASEMYADNSGHEMYANGPKGFSHELDGVGRPHEIAAPEYVPVANKDAAVVQGRLG
jgi:hypothetical protein